jgi:hypothetical protein
MEAFLSHHPPVRLVPWFFDHSPPSSTEVKKEWRYTSTSLHAFMAWTGKTLCLPFKELCIPYVATIELFTLELKTRFKW